MSLVVIGGGSTYCPELFYRIAKSKVLPGKIKTVVLYDVDKQRAEIVGSFCRKMLEAESVGIEIKVTDDPSEAFEGAEIVFNMMRAGAMEGRFGDEMIPLKYKLIGQETMGLGGFRLLRRQIEALRGILPYIPQGVKFFNFANPANMLSMALCQMAGDKLDFALGLCNIPFGIRMEITRVLRDQRPELQGLSDAEIVKDVQIDSVGVNHLTFFRNFRFRGEDVTEQVMRFLTNPPANFDAKNVEDISAYLGIVEEHGIFPNWYWRYRQEPVKHAEDLIYKGSEQSRAWIVRQWEIAQLKTYKNPDQPLDDILASLLERGGAGYALMAVEALEGILTDSGARLIVNVRNVRPDGRAYIPWLPTDAFIEVPCFMHDTGPVIDWAMDTSLPSEFSQAVRREVLSQNQFTRAQLTGDRTKELIALQCHPLIGGVAGAEACRAIQGDLDTMVQGLPPLVV
ncbi:MAG: hypothetical protein NT099_01490 [Candidatus Saganbacteria bacterium]|nr:hypothetical protein [Candidatus Saganbacteria bacterium]